MPASQVPLPASNVDWTALHNFATLRGQLRVSFTPRCNIACWFCHNEGDAPPPLTRKDRSHQPRPRQLDADAYLTVIGALVNAGLSGCTSPAVSRRPRRWPGRCWKGCRSPAWTRRTR